jgi:hypothetical protein
MVFSLNIFPITFNVIGSHHNLLALPKVFNYLLRELKKNSHPLLKFFTLQRIKNIKNNFQSSIQPLLVALIGFE